MHKILFGSILIEGTEVVVVIVGVVVVGVVGALGSSSISHMKGALQLL